MADRRIQSTPEAYCSIIYQVQGKHQTDIRTNSGVPVTEHLEICPMMRSEHESQLLGQDTRMFQGKASKLRDGNLPHPLARAGSMCR